MDKFGIFKFISSLLEFYKNNPPENKENSTLSNGENFLSSLLKPKNEETSKESQPKTIKPQQKQPGLSFLPLQEGMLKTMTSHDDFVKRVRDKYKI